MTDPIADLLVRIKNAYMKRGDSLFLPSSKMKLSICDVLKKEGYISDYQKKEIDSKPQIEIKLKFVGKNPMISNIKRISKPGRRVYLSVSEIKKKSRNRLGIGLLSTSSGIITYKEAIAKKIGGEALVEIW